MMNSLIGILIAACGIYGLYKWTRFINNKERLDRNIERQNLKARYGIVEFFARRKIGDCGLLVGTSLFFVVFALGHAKGIAWAFPTGINLLVLYVLFNELILGKIRYNDEMMTIFNWYRLPEKVPYDNVVSVTKERAFVAAGRPNIMEAGFDGEFLRITYLNKNKYLRELSLPYQYFVGVDLLYHKLRTVIAGRQFTEAHNYGKISESNGDTSF